jgi:hypothetical protein
VPTQWVCIVFIVLFAISGLLHTGQLIKWRTWWMLVMAVGCLGEVIGWSGRLWSSKSPDLLNPFLMQITTTIISPSFMSAANFTILGAIIRRFGPKYSWLTPRWCTFLVLKLESDSDLDCRFDRLHQLGPDITYRPGDWGCQSQYRS